MARRIKIKGGTTQAWSSTDPILSDREIAYEKNTKKIKVGDGVNKWSALDGINADTLDGKNSTDFWSKQDILSFDGQIPSNVIFLNERDLNSVIEAGWYKQTADINATPERHYPVKQAGTLIVSKSVSTHVTQIYIIYVSNRIYIRNLRVNGTSSSNWVQIFTTKNQGPGSGLNADLLDGKHGTDFWSKVEVPAFYGQLLQQPKVINDGVDYNTVTNAGLYLINSVNPHTPRPLTGNSFLLVAPITGTNFMIQLNIHYDRQMFIRTLEAGIWNDWVKIINSTDTYSKTEADTKYATKADTYTRSQLYTKSETTALIPSDVIINPSTTFYYHNESGLLKPIIIENPIEIQGGVAVNSVLEPGAIRFKSTGLHKITIEGYLIDPTNKLDHVPDFKTSIKSTGAVITGIGIPTSDSTYYYVNELWDKVALYGIKSGSVAYPFKREYIFSPSSTVADFLILPQLSDTPIYEDVNIHIKVRIEKINVW